MSDPGLSRRKQQLLDKFLAGEIDKATYDSLLADLHELDSNSKPQTAFDNSGEFVSSPSFQVTESQTGAERAALSQPVVLLEPGMELGGFQLKRRLRRGGMGEVWQAYDTTGERTVVIKVLPPELQRSPDEMARVKQTFNRVHNLQHQHICPVYLLGQDPRFGYFIVMKYLDGDTLSAYRKAYGQRNPGEGRKDESKSPKASLAQGALPFDEVIRLLMPVAQALDYAHGRQIIHRDIKPQNIMLTADGTDVQLVDFGLAAEVRTSVMRVSQVQMETCGTYPYMAPEQWRGELQDARTDQYALAVVAFELLSGHLPFEAADPTVLRMCVLNDPVPVIDQLSSAINDVIATGMAKLRTDRFESCVAFVQALAKCRPADTKAKPKNLRDATLDFPEPLSTPSTSAPIPLPSSSGAGNRATRSGMGSRPGQAGERSSRSTQPLSNRSGSSRDSTRKLDDEDLDDLELLERDDDDLMESEDDGKTRRSGRRQPSVRRVRHEAAMEQVNRRAMIWIALIGGTVCASFIGMFGWFLMYGMNKFFGPSDPDKQNSSNQIASVQPNNTQQNGGQGAGANGGQNVVPPVPARPDDKTALRYRWEQGKQYVYSVNVDLEHENDVIVSLNGNTTYSLGQPVAGKKGDPDAGKGTGTGFVVQANGYLVTCQHVVDDASEIEVAIGGKTYAARIVIEDVEHDLAVIRIDANGLPTLPLADSDSVQLGEDVRAIGFPFSSILGANVKATRGTISGVNQEEGRKVFQVDAGINPGNSGGPLVNDRGEVIGVNFAKLREEVATNVGFAVPINDAIQLLKSEGVTYARGDGKSPKLEGPELVKKVSAATALITVNTGGGPAVGLNHFELRCQGGMSSSVRSKSGGPLHHTANQLQSQHSRSVTGRFTQPDVLETDPLGRVHELTGERTPLPAFMGPLSLLVMEQLPSTRRPTWTNSFAITVVISEESGDALNPPGRFRPRIRPPGFPGFPPMPGFPGGAAKTTRIPGKIRIVYTTQESVGDLVKIKKEFDLEATEPGARQPRVKLTGNGVFTFDTKLGIPNRMEYTATLVENEQNKTTKLPIKLTYQLANGQGGPLVAGAGQGQVPAAAMEPGKPVEANTAIAVGTRLLAEWAGKWLPVDVTAVRADGKVRIHWVGWGEQFDEELPRTRLRFPPGVDPAQANANPPVVPQPVVKAVPHQFSVKLSVEDIDKLLEDLKSDNAGKILLAATKLQHAEPIEERRDEVLKALELLLKDKDQFRRKQAVDSLATWAKSETVPLLIKVLDEPALLVKLAAIDALGKLKDERAAEPLAKLVQEPGPRVQAINALRSLGKIAEKAVAGLLMHAEAEVRREGCRLLQEIGTAASLPALQGATNDMDKAVGAAAKMAVEAIEKRKSE